MNFSKAKQWCRKPISRSAFCHETGGFGCDSVDRSEGPFLHPELDSSIAVSELHIVDTVGTRSPPEQNTKRRLLYSGKWSRKNGYLIEEQGCGPWSIMWPPRSRIEFASNSLGHTISLVAKFPPVRVTKLTSSYPSKPRFRPASNPGCMEVRSCRMGPSLISGGEIMGAVNGLPRIHKYFMDSLS